MFDLWTKNRRRKKIVNEPVPLAWPKILATNLWYWRALSESQRQRLLALIAIFIREKQIVVHGPASLHETVRLVVAGAACVMLLGFNDWYCFDRVSSVVVFPRPKTFQVSGSPSDVIFGEQEVAGLYSRGSPIVLSWNEVLRDCRHAASDNNVVIHEFAHHVDDLDGALAGDPPFPTSGLRRQWTEVVGLEFERLNEQVARDEPTVIDPYGMDDKVEFFAVACEAFFCDPWSVSEFHPELFRLLEILFRLDPRQWVDSEGEPNLRN
jgi:Mlc titration factor MtfA (ptsG expression regulator)